MKDESRFPASLFFVYLIVLFIMSGVHIGLLILMIELNLNKIIQTIIPIIYWDLVALGLVLFTRKRVQEVYDTPMQELANATKQVANGDFSVYISPFHHSDQFDYLDIMIVDFNKMVEALGSVETLKTEFFSNVSHEIKTPLSIIQNNAELLELEDLTPKEMNYVHTIHQSSKRLSSLITNILKLNKLEKQSITPTFESYDLCEQLAQCAINYETAWEDKNIEFDADMEDHAYIAADASLMELVWNNLFSNAVKFTDSKGIITLKEVSTRDTIEVSVQDSGCGMDKETMKHIFDKFYQGDTSRATAGNGLGLALAMRVLQLNHFKIEVQSTLGEGSTFTVIMPKEIHDGKL